MLKEIRNFSEDKMKKSVEAFKKELQSLKAGRANPSMLDKISVEYYGTMTPVAQMATVSTPEARTIVIQPWDRNLIKDMEKAILKSDLGITPSNDGVVIRLTIPELTEETRRNLVKVVKKNGEETKVIVRNVRRDANDKLKALKKEATVSEDDIKKLEEEIQKLTDSYIKEVDKIVDVKEKEIMSI